MNRIIKFRAWDKRQEVMILSNQIMRLEFGKDGIDWLGCWVVVADSQGDPEQGLHQIAKEDLELMQFTGLLDKNGKEIYEGDILERLSWDVVTKPENKERMKIGGNVYDFHGNVLANKKGEPYIIHEIKYDEREEFKGNKFGYYWGGDYKVVEFQEDYGGFTPFTADPNSCCGSPESSTMYRIIGNIYENPELTPNKP